jgi:hypothetical protein
MDLPTRLRGTRRAVETGVDRDGEGRNRTGDTTVFSRVLYALSYLATDGAVSHAVIRESELQPAG